jgi:hypothetical protein
MTGNGQRPVNGVTARLEVRWSRSAWKPRIACDSIATSRLIPDHDSESMTLYRRSGGRGPAAAGLRKSMPVVDWVAVRYENPPSRITF